MLPWLVLSSVLISVSYSFEARQYSFPRMEYPSIQPREVKQSMRSIDTSKVSLCKMLKGLNGVGKIIAYIIATAKDLNDMAKIEHQIPKFCEAGAKDGCAESSPCWPGGSCRLVEDQPVCSCGKFGFSTGDTGARCQVQCISNSDCDPQESCLGFECKDMCGVEGTCGTGTVCQTINHVPVCACKKWFFGDPKVACTEAVCDPPCTIGNGNCPQNGGTCICNKGWEGDSCSEINDCWNTYTDSTWDLLPTAWRVSLPMGHTDLTTCRETCRNTTKINCNAIEWKTNIYQDICTLYDIISRKILVNPPLKDERGSTVSACVEEGVEGSFTVTERVCTWREYPGSQLNIYASEVTAFDYFYLDDYTHNEWTLETCKAVCYANTENCQAIIYSGTEVGGTGGCYQYNLKDTGFDLTNPAVVDSTADNTLVFCVEPKSCEKNSDCEDAERCLTNGKYCKNACEARSSPCTGDKNVCQASNHKSKCVRPVVITTPAPLQAEAAATAAAPPLPASGETSVPLSGAAATSAEAAVPLSEAGATAQPLQSTSAELASGCIWTPYLKTIPDDTSDAAVELETVTDIQTLEECQVVCEGKPECRVAYHQFSLESSAMSKCTLYKVAAESAVQTVAQRLLSMPVGNTVICV